jgi:hypothetical protein
MPREKYLVIDRKNNDGIFPRETVIKSSKYQENKDYTIISDGVYIIHSLELRKFILDIRDDDFFSDVPSEEELEVKVMVNRESDVSRVEGVEESPKIQEITDQEAQQIEQQRPFFPKPKGN